MYDWSLVSEYFAMILLCIIALFYYDAKAVRRFHARRVTYWWSLLLSALSIVLNIFSVRVIENIGEYSIGFAVALNTVYFFVSWLMISVIVYYLFQRILEFVYDRRHLRLAQILLLSILGIFALLLLINLRTGIIFSFDAHGVYCRGPMNSVGYILPSVEVLLLLICCVVHRRVVGPTTQKILFVSAPISILLMIYQSLFPEQLMNGAICSLVNLIIFISCRGGREDQDPVTGLANHRHFIMELDHRTKARRNYQLVLVRLRSLSRINRAYGQNGGDVMLFKVGDALMKLGRDADVFRYSDEGFAIIFPDSIEQRCDARLRQVTELMRQRWKIGAYETSLYFSVIDLRYSGQSWSIEDICGYLSDAAHIAATEDMEVFHFVEQLVERHHRREYVLRSMRHALEDNRFRVWFQPIYYGHSGRFESVEALLRMIDENGDPISPSEFIPIAEETGQIDDLTALVLEHSCRLLSHGHIPELHAVSINLPIRQVVEPDLQDRFRAILAKYGIRPEQIRLEITERDILEAGASAETAMRDLYALGYRFMLDDFGIGYSNISRVLTMPLDSIKLDRSLVLLLEENDRERDIMKDHIIPLFRAIGQSIVAEGVETAALAQLVLDCNVDRIQGFYYAKPMSEHALRSWYAARSIS